jgi:Family of unknown function (DUF5984)
MKSTPTPEHLFQFELAPVENIKPWGNYDDDSLSLSLYALTDGHFRISVGKETLLRYTPEIISLWGLHKEDADYQVACFARDLLASVPAVITPIPTFFENIIRDESLFRKLQKYPIHNSYNAVPSGVIDELDVKRTSSDFKEEYYNAFRWLGERSIWLNYLSACPNIWFVRVGNEVWIQWDNVDRKYEDTEVWTARCGTYVLSVQAFLSECHSFSERLLSAMESRIVSIENGFVRAQIPLDIASLRNQLLKFKNEFEKSLTAKYEPDIDWEESEKAMRTIALNYGIIFPVV